MHMEWYWVRLTAQLIPLVLKCTESPSAWFDCSFMCALEASLQFWAALSGAGCWCMWLWDLSPRWCSLSFCVLMTCPVSEVSAVAGDTHLRHSALEALCGTCAQALKCIGEEAVSPEQALHAVDLGEVGEKLTKTEEKGEGLPRRKVSGGWR